MTPAGRGVALAIALVVVGAACGDTSSTLTTAPTTTEAEAATTTAQPPDDDVVELVQVHPGDLPGGWVECCRPEVFSDDLLQQHMCGTTDSSLRPHTAGLQTGWSWNLRPDGTEDGHLTAVVLLGVTRVDTQNEFKAVNSPDYHACTTPNVEAEALLSMPPATGPVSTTVERDAIVLTVPAILDRYLTTVPVGSATGTVFTAVVRFYVGRALYRLNLKTYDAPVDSDVLVGLATALVTRAQQIS